MGSKRRCVSNLWLKSNNVSVCEGQAGKKYVLENLSIFKRRVCKHIVSICPVPHSLEPEFLSDDPFASALVLAPGWAALLLPLASSHIGKSNTFLISFSLASHHSLAGSFHFGQTFMHGCGGLNDKCLSQVQVFERLVLSGWHFFGEVVGIWGGRALLAKVHHCGL